jgi:hypothetical protein
MPASNICTRANYMAKNRGPWAQSLAMAKKLSTGATTPYATGRVPGGGKNRGLPGSRSHSA